MFSNTKPVPADAANQEDEKNAIKSFLSQSNEFKKMKEIANKINKNGFPEFINRLEACSTINDLINQCAAQYDIANHDNIVAYNLGRNKVNALLYTFGFFFNEVNFNYYGLHLYESIYSQLKPKSPNVTYGSLNQ